MPALSAGIFFAASNARQRDGSGGDHRTGHELTMHREPRCHQHHVHLGSGRDRVESAYPGEYDEAT